MLKCFAGATSTFSSCPPLRILRSEANIFSFSVMSADSEINVAEVHQPDLYSFPPFFTLQPNINVRSRQLSEWAQLIEKSCRVDGLHYLDIVEATTYKSPFSNELINRRLSLAGLQALGEFLIAGGQAVDGGLIQENDHFRGSNSQSSNSSSLNSNSMYGKRLLLFPKSIFELAKDLYAWAESYGKLNHVETLYEIQQSKNEIFYKLPINHLKVVVEHLQKSGKAELALGSNGNVAGVKFFSS